VAIIAEMNNNDGNKTDMNINEGNNVL